MKKRLTLTAALFACALATHAQTEKGKTMLGGNVSFLSTKVSGAPKSNVSFSTVPSVGYFIANNFAIGIGAGYTYKKEYNDPSRGLNQAFQASPFGRYYAALSDQFKFFGQVAVPMEFGSTKTITVDGNTGNKLGTTTNIGVTLAPGFAFFPTKHIGIEISVDGLKYNHSQFKTEANNVKFSDNSFNLGASTFAPKLGVMFHF